MKSGGGGQIGCWPPLFSELGAWPALFLRSSVLRYTSRLHHSELKTSATSYEIT